MTRIRRTQKEIAAGLTVENKKRGVTLEQQLEQNEQHANTLHTHNEPQDAACMGMKYCNRQNQHQNRAKHS